MTENERAIRILQDNLENLSRRIDSYIVQAQAVQHEPERYEHLLGRIDVTMRVYQTKMAQLAERMRS